MSNSIKFGSSGIFIHSKSSSPFDLEITGKELAYSVDSYDKGEWRLKEFKINNNKFAYSLPLSITITPGDITAKYQFLSTGDVEEAEAYFEVSGNKLSYQSDKINFSYFKRITSTGLTNMDLTLPSITIDDIPGNIVSNGEVLVKLYCNVKFRPSLNTAITSEIEGVIISTSIVNPNNTLSTYRISFTSNNGAANRTIRIGGSSAKVIAGRTYIGSGDPKGYDVEFGANGHTISGISFGSDWTTISDKRDKIDIRKIDRSDVFLSKLIPVTFRYNRRSLYNNDSDYMNGTLASNTFNSGFIAQDVFKALLDTYNDDNYAEVVNIYDYDNVGADSDQYMLDYLSLIPFIVDDINTIHNDLLEIRCNISGGN